MHDTFSHLFNGKKFNYAITILQKATIQINDTLDAARGDTFLIKGTPKDKSGKAAPSSGTSITNYATNGTYLFGWNVSNTNINIRAKDLNGAKNYFSFTNLNKFGDKNHISIGNVKNKDEILIDQTANKDGGHKYKIDLINASYFEKFKDNAFNLDLHRFNTVGDVIDIVGNDVKLKIIVGKAIDRGDDKGNIDNTGTMRNFTGYEISRNNHLYGTVHLFGNVGNLTQETATGGMHTYLKLVPPSH
jgi:hypothetical protein